MLSDSFSSGAGTDSNGASANDNCDEGLAAETRAVNEILRNRYGYEGRFVVLGTGNSGTINTPVKGLFALLQKELQNFQGMAHTQIARTSSMDKVDLSELVETAQGYAGQLANIYGNDRHRFAGTLDGDKKPQWFYHNRDSMERSLGEVFSRGIQAIWEHTLCRRLTAV